MRHLIALLTVLIAACNVTVEQETEELFVTILGVAQDAGSPQIGCNKDCCIDLWDNPDQRQKVISLGIVDKKQNQVWLLDATPDLKDQLQNLLAYIPGGNIESVKGIFLTHAHIGHYTGLMDLGREAMGANQVPVYAMPKMADYLSKNGPWEQLVSLNNIQINRLKADSTITLSEDLKITPFQVPHRDEYSETVGYKVSSPGKSFIFIPDIDKWHKWDRSIKIEVENTDYAFLDGAFYSSEELPNRDMSEIPHPFVPETIELFSKTSDEIRNKIIFIHLNHTNPLLRNKQEYNDVLSQGFRVGREGQIFSMN